MKVGTVSENVKKLLGLSSMGDDNIYMSATNITHMETSHPSDYAKYKDQIQNILAYPDYVGQNPNDNSIEYVKNFIIDNEYVKVAVRLSSGSYRNLRTERAAVAPVGDVGTVTPPYFYNFFIAKIADYLGCSVDYLLGRTDNPEINK